MAGEPLGRSPCGVLGCEREVAARKVCLKHYKRMRTSEKHTPQSVGIYGADSTRIGTLPELRPDLGPCWEWTASTNATGYGLVSVAKFGTRLAHRVVFMVHHGRIIERDIMHHCDNPPCVRPSHLREATHAENMSDRAAKGRAFAPRAGQPECKNGHRLTEATTVKYCRPDGYTETRCIECRRQGNKKQAARRKRARHERGLLRNRKETA